MHLGVGVSIDVCVVVLWWSPSGARTVEPSEREEERGQRLTPLMPRANGSITWQCVRKCRSPDKRRITDVRQLTASCRTRCGVDLRLIAPLLEPIRPPPSTPPNTVGRSWIQLHRCPLALFSALAVLRGNVRRLVQRPTRPTQDHAPSSRNVGDE